MAQLNASYDCSTDVAATDGSKNSAPHGTEYSELNVEGDSKPPTYETSQPPQYSDEPPPSYDSVIQAKIQKVRDESDGNADFAKRLLLIVCCGTIATIIGIVLSLAVPLASLIIGTIYLHDCPRERYIPIFLIVSGVFGVLRALSSSVFMCINRKKDEEEEGNKKANPFDGIVGCFLFAWLIAGSVWVYRIHNDYQSDDPSADDYCHKTLYLYAFWSLTVGYILLALFICCGCTCGIAIVCCIAKWSKNSNSSEREVP